MVQKVNRLEELLESWGDWYDEMKKGDGQGFRMEVEDDEDAGDAGGDGDDGDQEVDVGLEPAGGGQGRWYWAGRAVEALLYPVANWVWGALFGR